jgi:8-hydroxy-5-deazaflavin:NADPH oxidoreductase
LPPRRRLCTSSSGGPTRRWRRRPLKLHFGVLLEELDGLPSSAFVAKALTGAKLVKGFNHLVAATLAADPIVEAAPGCLSVERRRGRDRSRGGLGQTTRFAPVKLGKLNEGGALVHARGRTWSQLIFQDLLKKEK